MEYECWRVNGEFEASIQRCPEHVPTECMYFFSGDTCPGGKTIKI